MIRPLPRAYIDIDMQKKATVLSFDGRIGEGFPGLKLESVSRPTSVGPGEVLAKIRLCSICGSDLHTLSGNRKETTPSVLGHEAVAEVVLINGRGTEDIGPGDRITFGVADSCGLCRLCKDGLPQKCYNLFKYGHALCSDGSGLNGCYASLIVIRKGTPIVKIPDHVTDTMAVPVNCSLATMVNAVSRIRIGSSIERTMVIQGAGMLGLYGCALLRDKGFTNVFCTDIDDSRLKIVPDFGGIPWNTYTGECCRSIPQPDSVDAIIEVCGSPSVFSQGLKLLCPGGTYVTVGMVTPDSQLNITGEQIIRKCLTITGIHNYNASHLREAVEFLSRTCNMYPYEKLVSHSFGLAQYKEAFSLAATRQYQRVIMQPDDDCT